MSHLMIVALGLWQGAQFDEELHALAKKLRKVTPPGPFLVCALLCPPVSIPSRLREQRAVGAVAVSAGGYASSNKQKTTLAHSP